MTRASLARKAAWAAALAEGRIVRSNGGLTMTLFKTVDDAEANVRHLHAVGLDAEIVHVDPVLSK